MKVIQEEKENITITELYGVARVNRKLAKTSNPNEYISEFHLSGSCSDLRIF